MGTKGEIRFAVVVAILLFLFTQSIPRGFSANNQQLATAKETAVATKKIPTPTQSSPDPKAAAVIAAVADRTSTDFLSGISPITKPVVSAPSQAANSQREGKIISAVETKAATQKVVPQQAAQVIVSDVKNALTSTEPEQKKENLKQLKADVKLVAFVTKSPSDDLLIHYGESPAANGVLLLPEGHSADGEPVPVVIMIHGGGFTSGSQAKTYPQSEYLCANGYAVLNINYTLNNIDTALRDTLDAVQWVHDNASTYNLDADSLGIVGGSAGATLAVEAGIQASDQVSCVVAFSPVVVLPVNHIPTYSGPMPKDGVSPGTPPTLVVTGGSSDQVNGYPVGPQAIAFGEMLAANGVEGGTIVDPDGGHGESLMEPNKEPALQFLDANLKSQKKVAPASKPTKPVQANSKQEKAEKKNRRD